MDCYFPASTSGRFCAEALPLSNHSRPIWRYAAYLVVVTLALVFGLPTTMAATEVATKAKASTKAPKSSALAASSPGSNPPLSLQDQAFRDAFDAMERKRWDDFHKAARKISQHHILHDYVEYWRLRQRMNEATTPQLDLDNDVRRFIAKQPRSLTADLLRKKWILELGKRSEWKELLEHMPNWLRQNDTRVFCQAGRARLALGKPVGEQAVNAFRRDRNLDTECGPLATEMLAAGVIDHPELRRRMWRALEVRDWRSTQLLAEILGVPADHAASALRKPTKVLREFESLAGPTTSTQRDQLLIALVRLSRPKPMDAAEWMTALSGKLRQIERQFVWAQIAASAMRDMIPEAYGYAVRASDAPITDITRQWLARAAMRQKDWHLLVRTIGQMDSKAQSSPTWIYWRARSMRELGEKFGAEALLRKIADGHHYYGRLAAEELGNLVAHPENDVQVSAKTVASMKNKSGFIRARKFYELGIRYQGNREWLFQTRGWKDEMLLAAARYACNNDMLERCISTAVRTRKKHDFALRFISPYREKLTPVAARHGIDLAWVYGLIRQESRFLPDARSSAGARGLMQIMPATGRWIATKMGVRGYQSKHLYQPDTNLDFGAFYLKTVYDDLQNSRLLASAAYNAGPKRPRRWMSTLPGDVDGALFVEIIPFSQTRTYVKKVLLNTAYYESVFSGQPQSLKSLLGKVPLIPYRKTSIP